MSPLERRYRRLLRCYPAQYRADRADEMLDTLLATAAPGQRWPAARESAALVRGGIRARAGVNASQPAAASWWLCLLPVWSVTSAARVGHPAELFPVAAVVLVPFVVALIDPRPAFALAIVTIAVTGLRTGPLPLFADVAFGVTLGASVVAALPMLLRLRRRTAH